MEATQWKSYSNMTRFQKNKLLLTASNRVVVFLNDGSIKKYDEAFQLEKITHYYILPYLPKL